MNDHFKRKLFVGKQCCKVIYYSKSENKTFEHEFQITKKLGTSENLSWVTKSSYFRLIDFTLAYYVCSLQPFFSQNIIQREKCPWTLEECLSPTIVPIHAYLLFGVVVDFVSRFFIRHENHRKKICQLMFAHCPFFWKLSTKTSCRQRQWVCCKSISGLASTVQRVNNGPNIF